MCTRMSVQRLAGHLTGCKHDAFKDKHVYIYPPRVRCVCAFSCARSKVHSLTHSVHSSGALHPHPFPCHHNDDDDDNDSIFTPNGKSVWHSHSCAIWMEFFDWHEFVRISHPCCWQHAAHRLRSALLANWERINCVRTFKWWQLAIIIGSIVVVVVILPAEYKASISKRTATAIIRTICEYVMDAIPTESM